MPDAGSRYLILTPAEVSQLRAETQHLLASQARWSTSSAPLVAQGCLLDVLISVVAKRDALQDVIVDESMMPVTISFDRLRAVLILLRTAFSLAAVVIFIWAGIAGFSKVIHEPRPQLLVNQFVLFPMLLAIFVPLAWYPLRYRETLFTTFNVSDSGLVIENSRYGVLVLGWHDVNGAVYSRLGGLIRLRSPKLATTVAIMRDHKASFSREFESARGMIRKGVREQWSEQWL